MTPNSSPGPTRAYVVPRDPNRRHIPRGARNAARILASIVACTAWVTWYTWRHVGPAIAVWTGVSVFAFLAVLATAATLTDPTGGC